MSWDRTALSIANVFDTLNEILKPWIEASKSSAKEFIGDESDGDVYANLGAILNGLLGTEEQRSNTIKALTDMAKEMLRKS